MSCINQELRQDSKTVLAWKTAEIRSIRIIRKLMID